MLKHIKCKLDIKTHIWRSESNLKLTRAEMKWSETGNNLQETRNSETKPPKWNNRNKRNHRNDENEMIET